MAVVLAAAAVLVAGCVQLTGPAVAVEPGPAAARCGAPSYSCLLPFPSNRFTRPDPDSATGLRPYLPPDAFPASVLDKVGPRDLVEQGLASSDGFSPVSPVLFQVPDSLGPSSVPADGGDVIEVWNLSTRRRVPIRAELADEGYDELGRRNIVVVWPVTVFDQATTFLAVIRRGMLDASGNPAVASPSLADAPNEVRDAARSVHPEIPWGDYLAATTFTTRSQATIDTHVNEMASIVRAADHPIRNIELQPPLVGGAVAVSGQVRVTDFRDAAGMIPLDRVPTPSEHWVDFLLALPSDPPAAGAPIFIYGHGITASKETMIVLAGQQAAKGFATVGIDLPNHGSRTNEGGYMLDLAYPSELGRLTSMLLQSELDHLSLLRAIQQHFSEIDVYPLDPVSGRGGDGRRDVNPTEVLYSGTSLGGVLGAEFVSLAPELKGALFQVPGSGIMDTLYHSVFWDVFKSAMPGGLAVGDAAVMTFMAQSALDRADNTFYLDRIRATGMPVLVEYAIGDGLVPNTSTDRMLALLDLPMMGTRLSELPEGIGSRHTAGLPADGRAFVQVPGAPGDTLLSKFATHLQFMDPVSVAASDRWLDQRAAALRRG
ncbi:MAG: hypothetical protein R2698_02710 [Microthrixaceae bacterium]